MRHFPLFTDLRGQPCLLVGGGEVAARKARQLLAADALVTVVAPNIGTELAAAVADNCLLHIPQRFEPGLVKDHLLIIAATSDRNVNRQVADAAAAAQRFCNVVDDAELSSFVMPAVIDRAPVTIAISTGGTSPILARLLRQQIEDWLPARIGKLARWTGQWRSAVKRRITDQNARLHFWENIVDGPAADALLAGDVERANETLDQELHTRKDGTTHGQAWLVGAGPGNPELITRRGAALLRRADVVLFDRLVSPQIVALARRDAKLIKVGKSPRGASTTQKDINDQLIWFVSQGLRVCRLKGGDPFIFGRGGEEIEALARAGLPYEVVPGITAAAGCAAAAAIPLTHRETASAVTFVTGHDAGIGGADWASLAASRQTLAIYMSVGRLAPICATLIEHGRAPGTPAAIVENGTSDEQRIVGGTLRTIADLAAEQHIAAPAILIVGDVVALADTLRWREDDDTRPAHTEVASVAK